MIALMSPQLPPTVLFLPKLLQSLLPSEPAKKFPDQISQQGVCENAVEKFPSPEPSLNLPATGSLNHKAKPFIPGSIDAIAQICGSSGSGQPLPALQRPMTVSQNVRQAATKVSLRPNLLPCVWACRTLSEFSLQAEPEDSYSKNGVITLDEDEAVVVRTKFDNALVGRVGGKTFNFEFLSKQLQDKWGSYDGFRVNDLGFRCFILFFTNREDRDGAWMGGPWYVVGCVVGLLLQFWG
ncbi:hypothetical protein KSP39_PZI014153 [Platanthera zijinensis]|uniref:DUF4283 domain-containing protein n=1 Tax=Platanthera zijinensis TaxID=2320716 RepID=A0AAP0G373_9ASPA